MTGIGRVSVSNMSNTIVNDVSDGDTRALNILHNFCYRSIYGTFIASWFFNMNLSWKYVVGLVAIMASIMVIVFANIIDNTRGRKSR